MATLDFPSNPIVGEIYAFQTRQWEWNGSGWQLVPVTAGVTSLNGMTGDILLEGGDGIAVAVRSGNVIGFDNTGVLDVNGMIGQVTLMAGLGMTITPQSGGVLLFEASVAGAVTSLNGMNGDVTLQAGANITITPLSGNGIEISATGGGVGGELLCDNSAGGSILFDDSGDVIYEG